MIRSAAVAALAAAALFTAAPAAADDQTFLEVLDLMGIAVDDPAVAVSTGRAACTGLDEGQPLPTVVDGIAAANGLTADQSGLFVGASVAAFCDQHRALVGH